jgi:parvulin-like peptidyl-prolyl isomerase
MLQSKHQRPKIGNRKPTTEYYIFRIDEKESAKDKPFDQVRKQVEFEYKRKRTNEAISKFIMETFNQQKVRIYEEAIRGNFQASK